MTKTLKGLPGRTFTTSTTEDFISARNLFLTQPVDQLTDGAIVGSLRALDQAEKTEASDGASDAAATAVAAGKAGALDDSFTVLPCCATCGKSMSGAHQHNLGATLSGQDVGSDLAIPPTLFDEPTLTVNVGDSVTAVIDFTGDQEQILVDLVAGQTYLISLVGSGSNPVTDTFLTIIDANGNLHSFDDDGGNGTYSLITLTAAFTGTYQILAESFNNPGDPGTGEYTVTVIQQGPDEAPTVPPPNVPYTVGDTAYGFIDPSAEGDTYQVTLTAGMIYNFSVAAGADYATPFPFFQPGEVDTIIEIFDANGFFVAGNDDISFPADLSSAVSFIAAQSGTYFVRVRGYPNLTGGYVLESEELDIGDFDPVDSFNWLSADNVTFDTVPAVPTAYVYFGAAGENFGELADDGVSPAPSFGWNATEMAAVMAALEEYEHILGVNYEITTDLSQATFRLFTTTSTQFGAYFYPQDPAYGTQQGIGAFNVDSGGWSLPGQPGLQQGGYDFSVILHEFGHAHGLKHPHDNGGGGPVLLGVTAATGSYGVFNLNQGVYSVMSYNDAWDFHPDGPTPFTIPHVDSGWTGTLNAFDIAVLQQRYGVHAYNGGDNLYTITDVDDDAFYSCIWDSGGTDEIAYSGSLNAVIDLTAATLDYSPTGGGVLSFVRTIWGGYTIANGVVIENATSGGGNDMLIGNAADNVLTAGLGNDVLIGREGDDTLDGGGGSDTVIFGGNFADYTIVDNGGGNYTITDNNAADGDDGTDTVLGAETLQFADDVIAPDPDPLNNDIPTLGGWVAALTFNENVVNATPQLIDANVDFQDDDFNGGTLTISGLLAEDVVSVRDEGSGAGQIDVSGNQIRYNGTLIGTFTGGNGTSLVVTLTSGATAPAVDALIQNLTYANSSQDPTLNRTLTIALTDDQGAAMTIVPTVVHSFVELTGAADPLANPPLPNFGANPNPGFVDVDGDGDRDMVMGAVAGTFRYLQRSGATYTEITGAANPFNGFDVGSYSNPEAIDIDGDGDMDLVSGAGPGIAANNGTLFTWRNNGAGSWTQLTGAANPFNGVDVGAYSDPAAIDLNGDGRFDLVSGTQAGTVATFIHNADHTFTLQVGAANPFNGLDLGTNSSPAAIDVDGDGDADLLFAISTGVIRTFINNGGAFTEATGVNNPFNGLNIGSFANLSSTDLDNDGDVDLVTGAFSPANGTRVFDHVVTLVSSPDVAITVNAQNDAPSGTNKTISLTESAAPTAYVFTLADFGYSDIDGDNFASVVINTLPTQGALRLGAALVTAGQVITVASITSGQLTFTPDANESGPLYATFNFSVRDDGGTANGGLNTDASPNVMTISVTATSSPPTLTGVVDSVTYDENVVNATPQILDLDVTFNDPNNDFNGGTLEVSGLAPDDVVGINNEGTGAGQIGVSGSNVTYEGVVIGTVAGGAGADLVVTFNAAADSEAVEALIENLTYANSSDEPTPTRTLTINVTDADGNPTAFQPVFAWAGIGESNPFLGEANGGTYSTPTFIDVDNDGDMDMISGGNTGAIFYYRNEGGDFNETPGSQNPFNGMTFGGFSTTAAIDIDGDGDLDLAVGNALGYLYAIENNGDGSFTQLVGAANPFDAFLVDYLAAPAGGDIDGDGDMDLIVGNDLGNIATFRHNADHTFTQLTGVNNPFNGIDVGGYSIPALFDIDGDGDLDALINDETGTFLAFNNGGVFTPAPLANNPFDGVAFGYGGAIGFGDIDGDGDLDAAIGGQGGIFEAFFNVTDNASIVVNVTAQVDRVQLLDDLGNEVATFHNIQDAINAALDDYTIIAQAGDYDEDLVVDKDVTIEGANVGVAGTDGGRGAETSINGSVTISADGVTIDGVAITGDSAGPLGSTGVIVDSGSDDFSLVNSVLDGTGNFAIFVGLVSGLDVGHNLLQGYVIGMYISGGNTDGSVHDNRFQGAGGPFTGMGNGVNSETSHVTILNNIFDGIYAGSLNLYPFGPDPVDLDTYVIGNTISDPGPDQPVQVYATVLSTHIAGTHHNEAFVGDPTFNPAVNGLSLGFDGEGGDDSAFGNSASDDFTGGTGNDRLYGGGGDDSLTGDSGNDLLDGEGGIDTGHFAATNLTYTDTVIGWLITSSEGNDFAQRLEIIVNGSGQRNLLVGSTGFGTIQDASDEAQNGDIIRLASGTYSESVNYSAQNLLVLAQPGAIQNVDYATASGFGITIVAADGNDTITTGDGDDLIIGGGGDDDLSGGGGNDTFYGEGGNDTTRGGTGDDVYIVDTTGDVVIEAVGEGSDSVLTQVSFILTAGADVELLSTTSHAGTAAIELTGNYGNQTIYGNAGNNVITGGTGTDVLIGFGGNDVYIVHDGTTSVLEDAGAGNDTVFASVSFALAGASSVELLSTTFHLGTSAINLTGSSTSQTIFGNAGANVLDGKGGADILVGFAGADTFAFTSALGGGNIDIIDDFLSGTDKIALDDAVFSALSAGSLPAGAFVIGTAAGDADDRIIYNSATGALFYDADGNGAGAAVQFATLNGHPTLVASDFQVI